jgi:acyl-CoA thioester hydrolase
MMFKWPVRVYWEDTDSGGIVFYANYLKFFERARTEWLRSFGLEQQNLLKEHQGLFIVSETQMKYHQPCRLDDLLSVSAKAQEVGKASLVIAQTATRLDGNSDVPTLLCEGSIRIGWVNAQTLKPARIPQIILDYFL